MTFHISKDFIFGFAALLLLMAFIIVNSKADKPGRKWVSPVIFALVLLGSWFGWFCVIRGIAEKFN